MIKLVEKKVVASSQVLGKRTCPTSYWFGESWNESTFPLSEFDETWCAIAGHLWYETHPISKL